MVSRGGAIEFAIVLAMSPVAPAALAQDTPGSAPAVQQAQAAWSQQAERTFRLGRGLGRELMTQEEWQAYQQKMQTMTAEERERYRQDMHQQMVERARERGISMPETPGARNEESRMPGQMGRAGMGGPGMGGSGMGRPGMGPGGRARGR